MAQNLFKCSLVADKANIKVYKYLKNNKTIVDVDNFIEDITNILFKVTTDLEGALDASEADNIRQYVEGVGNNIATFATIVDSQSKEGESNLNEIAGLGARRLSNRIEKSINKRLDLKRKALEDVIPETAIDTRVDDEVSLANYLTELGEVRDIMHPGMMQYDKIIDLYFNGIEDYAEPFRNYFIDKFSDSLIDTRIGRTRPVKMGDDISHILDKMQLEIEEIANFEHAGDITVDDLISNSAAAKEIYFANVIMNEFPSLVRTFLPGVNIADKGYKFRKDSVRAGYGYDGKFSGFDQATAALQMHLYTTPRLTPVEGSNNEFTTDEKNPKLGTYEIKNVANKLNALPSDLEGFKTGLYRMMNSNTPDAPIMRSLYYKFFSDEDYVVDGVHRASYATIIEERQDERLDNILSALMTDLRSNQRLEHMIVDNGNSIITKSADVEMESVLKEHLNINLTDHRDVTKLNPDIARRVKVVLDETSPNGLKILIDNDYVLEFNRINKSESSGVKVMITPESGAKISDTATAANLLKRLGTPNYISKKFLDYYNDNIDNYRASSTSVGGLTLPNLVGNYAYMIAMNDEVNREKLNLKGFDIPKMADTDGKLDYPILETLHSFTEPLADMLNVTEGTTAKVMRTNINGDQIATAAPKARLYDAPNIINRLRKAKDSFFQDNVLVGGLEGTGAREYTLLGFRAKDGITQGLVSKGNSKLSKREQLQYLIEHAYLGIASKSGWQEALFQPGVMSDRSLIELGYFKSNSDRPGMLPESGGALDTRHLKDQFIRAQRNQHNNTVRVIVDSWTDQLLEWSKDKNTRLSEKKIKEIKKSGNIKKLAEFVKKSKIDYFKVRSSGLTSGLMYKENKVDKNTSYAIIKDVIVELDEIWNNPTKASNFTDEMLAKFKDDLARVGYTSESLSPKSIDLVTQKFNAYNRDKAFDILTTGYFYQSNTLSNSVLDLTMGSLYQFKGDTDVNSILASEQFQEDTKGHNLDKKEQFAKRIALHRALDSMYSDQAKRNASLGSGHQLPRLVGDNEEGKYLGKHSNTAVIDDPQEMLNLLGNLDKETKQDVYDAAMFAHPLYFKRLNHSLGNEMSGYTSKGGAIKDISNEVNYKTGIFRFQKKATFNIFDYEMLRKGTPELHRLFTKMNKSIKFSGGPIIYEGEQIEAKNMQELWEHFGAYSNEGKGVPGDINYEPSSWDLVLEVLSVNPHIRDSYIEKVGFVSGEKTGNKSVNSKGVWKGNETLKYTPFSNEHHGVILQADHEPDTTASGNLEVDADDSLVSLMTQVISAVAFEGDSALEAEQINEALLSLSETGLDKIKHSIYATAIDILTNWTKASENTPLEGEEDWFELVDILKKYDHTPEETSKIDTFIQKYKVMDYAEKEYARKLVADAVSRREDYGSTTDYINMGTKVPLSSKLLHNTLHSSVMAEFNRATTRVKFKGGQYVVAASFDFIKSYPVEGGRSLQRDEFMKSSSIKPQIIKSIANLIPTDLIWVAGTEENMPLWEAQKYDNFNELLEEGRIMTKVLPNPEVLQWIKYKDNTGKELKDYQEYKDLQEETDPKKRAILEDKIKEILSDESRGWETIDSEFYMPQTHKAAYNLRDSDTIDSIMGNFNTETEDGRIKQRNQMIEFFEGRIRAADSGSNGKYGFIKRPLKSLTIGKLKIILDKAEAEYKYADEDTFKGNHVKNRLNLLRKTVDKYAEYSDEDKIREFDLKSINDQNSMYSDELINELAKEQADSFPKTLELIASRIPGQGKQSYTAGRVKGYITSQRNTVYGPLEMLKITGADHDVDKSSIIVYSVNPKTGVFYSYDRYLNEDKTRISKKAFQSYFNNKRSKYIKSLVASNESNIKEKLAEFDKVEYEYLSEATKNFIVDRLLKSARDPKNALEAATPVSVERVRAEVDEIVDYIIEDGDLKMISEDTYSPWNPISIPLLEIVNTTGKSGVGIFATGLKGYAATFTAWRNGIKNNSKYIKFRGEQNLFQDREVLKLYDELYGASESGLHLYTGDGRRSTVKTIANTEKYIEELQRERDLGEIDMKPQAWEDLSALLSAATDNAKELILARIGATDSTSGIIATGIIMGFELGDILNLLKDPNVKKLLRNVEDSTDFTVRKNEKLSIQKAIKLYLEKTYGKKNSKVIEGIKAKNQEVEYEVESLVKLENDKKPVKEVKEFMNLNNTEDAVVQSLVGLNNNTGVFGSKSSTIEESIPTDSELIMLKNFMSDIKGLDFDKVDHAKALAAYKLVDNNKFIIFEKTKSQDPRIKMVALFAKKMGKPTYRIPTVLGRGKWFDYFTNDRIKAPVLMADKFAILSSKQLTNIERSVIDGMVKDSKDIIKDSRAYNKKIKDIIKSTEESIDVLKKERDNELHNFLNDGPRQLFQLQEIASELKAFTGILAINGGLPNGSWDVYHYLNDFITRVNTITGKETFMDFDKLENFVKSVEGDGKYAKEITDEYEKHKAGLNPFFLLQENKHYFGYIKALFAARSLIQNTSNVTRSIEAVAKVVGNVNDKEKFNSIEGYIYGLGINDFLQSTDYAKSFSLDGNKYDLTDSIDRHKFMIDIVEVSKKMEMDPELEHNGFINALRSENLKDNRLKEMFTIIRTKNLLQTDEHNRVVIRQGLRQLRDKGEKYTEFYDALYFYSLILNKGGLGSKSFSSLFGLDVQANEDYLNHLNTLNKSDKLINLALRFGELGAWLANPSTIKEVNTNIKVVDPDNPQHEEIEDQGEFNFFKRFSGLNDTEYNLDAISRKLNGDLIRSAQTGKIYMWNQNIKDGRGGYIVITPKTFNHNGVNHKLSHRAISHNITGNDVLSAMGYDFGETAIIDNSGGLGQVYYYDGKNYVVRTQNNRFIKMTPETLSRLNKDDMIFYRRNFGRLSMKQKNEISQKGYDIKEDITAEARFPYKASSILGGSIPNRVLDEGVKFFSSNTKTMDLEKGDSRLIKFGENSWYRVTNLGNTHDYFVNEGLKGDDRYDFLEYDKNSIGAKGIMKRIEAGKDEHNLYTVTPYKGEVDTRFIGDGKSVMPGTISQAIEESDLEVSSEYMKLASLATISYGIGKSQWVKDLTKVVQPKMVDKISPIDKVWIFGDNLSDNSDYAATVNSYKKLIDRAGNAGAEILIGKGSGVEEEVKVYLMDNYPGYTPTETGYVYNKPRGEANYIVFKDVGTNRFNSNNTILREGNIIGPYGTITYTHPNFIPNKGSSSITEYSLYSEEIPGWADVRNSEEAVSFATEISKEVGSVEKWDSMRDIALEEEALFIRKLVAVGVLTKVNKNRKIETEKDLKKMIQEELTYDEEYQEFMNEIFENGELILSNTLKLAMARNRFVTFNYFQERWPELFANMDHPAFAMINNKKAKEISKKDYKEMLNSPVVSSEDLELIYQDGEVMFRDIYHYLSTIGPNKSFTDKGRTKNEELNKFLGTKGIKAFKLKNSITVLDNDALMRFEAKLGEGIQAQLEPVTYVNEAKRVLSSQKVSKPVMRKVFNKLFSKYDVKARLLTRLDIESEFGKVYGKLSGWTTPEGEIIVNLDKATLDTPIHEFGGHIFLNNLKITNPGLYRKIIQMSLDSPLVKDLAREYNQLGEDGIGEEVFSTLFGLHNQGKLLEKNNVRIWDKIINLMAESESIVDFLSKAFNMVFNSESQYKLTMNDSLIDIIDKLGDDIIYGKGSLLEFASDKLKQDIQNMRYPLETQESIIEKLKALNSIKTVCI